MLKHSPGLPAPAKTKQPLLDFHPIFKIRMLILQTTIQTINLKIGTCKMESKMRMRYLAPFVLSALFLSACGGSDNSNSEKKDSAASSNEAPADNSMVAPGAAEAAASKGAALIEQ